MPFVIIPNPNGGILGPGLPIGWGSPPIDPWPENTEWQILFTGEGGANSPWLVARQSAAPNFGGRYTPMILNAGWSTTENISNTIADNSASTVIISLLSNGVVVDEERASGNWDARSGIPYILQNTPSVTGGFNAQDRANLQLAVDNSTVDLVSTSVPTDLTSVPVGRLPGDPPLLWSERVGPFQLVGRDVLDLPGSGQHGIWTGLRWFYGVIPPGWGMTPGAIDEFDARPAQLVPIVALQDGEEIGTPILDTNQSGGFQKLSPFDFTGKIAHDVAPGWSVSLFMFRVIGSG